VETVATCLACLLFVTLARAGLCFALKNCFHRAVSDSLLFPAWEGPGEMKIIRALVRGEMKIMRALVRCEMKSPRVVSVPAFVLKGKPGHDACLETLRPKP
jgi:hypothetical protein